MKKISIYLLALFTIVSTGCKKDYLTRYPLDQFTDETYWTNENNIRTFANSFYQTYFEGYGNGWTWGPYFAPFGGKLDDDWAPNTPLGFIQTVPASGGGWSFTEVRKANLFLDRVSNAPIPEEAKNHWMGVARFFRGLAYFELVKDFGDVPWFDKVTLETEVEELYKPKESRVTIMEKVLQDFQYAAENVKPVDGTAKQTVNKWVVLAYMSRVFLFEGTWEKYHQTPGSKSTEFLQAAKDAADQVITEGGFALASNYRTMFNSEDLAGNSEMILYRKYATGLLTHCLMSYVARESQTGPNKTLIDAYLLKDGLPIGLSPLYKGDHSLSDVMTDRDPRMMQTINSNEIRPNGTKGLNNQLGISSSGYATLKFLDETKDGTPGALSNTNTSDAPVMRLGEVMLNYAEAAAELGAITQADLDKSINKLRSRSSVGIAPLKLAGNEPSVDGVTAFDDPDRDPTVSPLLWEIRRERRVELTYEGLRNDDLRRWKKLDYLDYSKNPDLNRGAWIKASDWVKADGSSMLKDVVIEGGTEGYILAAPASNLRTNIDPRVYLNPLPLDQIKLYADKGFELKQNPGWQ